VVGCCAVRNYAVKFVILAARLSGRERPDPSDYGEYLDLDPEAALGKFKERLDESARGVLMFGFSDRAILDILDQEFEVDMNRPALVFRKPYLDSRSIALAGGGWDRQVSFTHREQAMIENLALWLLDATRELYRRDLDASRLRDIRQEYAECFGAYARKCLPNYQPGDAEVFLRSLFASLKTMRAFCHSLTVDAMFKADAAKVLFGEQSAYYQAWFRKQVFRHMMSKAVDQYIANCTV
jgi:hypothetical protein